MHNKAAISPSGRWSIIGLTSIAAALLVSAVSSGEPTEIRYLDWSTSKTIDNIIASFEKDNPDIKVTYEHAEWTGNNYQEKVAVWAAGGVLPDVVAIVPDMLPGLVESGALLPLDSYVSRDRTTAALDDFYPAAMQNSQWQGHQYGLPTVLDTWVVNINKDAFNNAGLATPSELYGKDQWTWQAMEDAARKITAKDPSGKTVRWGMWTFPGDAGIYPFLWAYGGSLFNADRTASTIGSPQSIAGISYMQKLMYQDGIFTFPDWYGMSIAAPWEQTMTKGNFGMQLWWSGLPSTYAKMKATWAYDQVPVPPGPVNPNTSYVKANSVVMAADTKHAEAAWKFMTYLTGRTTNAFVTQGASNIPPRRSNLNIWFERSAANGVTGAQYFADGLNRGRTPPEHSQIAQIDKVLQDKLLPIWQNKASVGPTLQALETQINALMSGQK